MFTLKGTTTQEVQVSKDYLKTYLKKLLGLSGFSLENGKLAETVLVNHHRREYDWVVCEDQEKLELYKAWELVCEKLG